MTNNTTKNAPKDTTKDTNMQKWCSWELHQQLYTNIDQEHHFPFCWAKDTSFRPLRATAKLFAKFAIRADTF